MHQLIYRGVTYTYTPESNATVQSAPAKAAHPSYKLSYRGASYAVNPNLDVKTSIFHPIARLMYRGVAYSTNG